MRTRAQIAVALVGAAGCFPGDQQASDAALDHDLAEYDRLEASLRGRRSEVAPDGAGRTLYAASDRLYLLEHIAIPPRLRAFFPASGERIEYALVPGAPDRPSVSASSTIIATGRGDGAEAIYQMWDADLSDALLGELRVPAPTREAQYWPYSVDGDAIYLVIEDDDGISLHRWRAGSQLQLVRDLHDVLDVGELGEIGVAGDYLALIESGRIWRLDLIRGVATWLRATTEITGRVSMDRHGAILAETAAAVLYLPAGSSEPIDVSAAIIASPYRINDTFAAAHHYLEGAILDDGKVSYIGNAGVFSYDLTTGEVAPLQLSPRSETVRVDFRQPVVAAAGLFVVGLTSTSGASGATGPVYHIHLEDHP